MAVLNEVKHRLDNLCDIRFSEYFTEYVMDVQDDNINREFDYLLNNNELTPISIYKLVDSNLERLVDYLDRSKSNKK